MSGILADLSEIKASLIPDRVKVLPGEWLDSELFYLQCNPSEADKLLNLIKESPKTGNSNNSSVLYCLGITDEPPVDKISQTPTSLPDFDFDTDKRDEIKRYLRDKYGREHTCLLGTKNTLGVKGSVKDALRVLHPDVTPAQRNIVTEYLDALDPTDYESDYEFFDKALRDVPRFREFFKDKPKAAEAIRLLLGSVKSNGIHAGGIGISSEAITSFIPVIYDSEEEMYVTQPDMGFVEAAGIIKYDFLGLSTLEFFSDCIKLIHERTGQRIELDDIPFDDAIVLNRFKEGKTESVFQFNTPLATGILTQIKEIPSLEVPIAVTALARPGPLGQGMDKIFIGRLNGSLPVSYDHEILKRILADTYGVVIYQEQVMRIVQDLGGLNAFEADTVRRAMGKKQKDKLQRFEDRFVNSCQKSHGLTAAKSKEIWEQLFSFAEYGFNKAHAVAYGKMGYACMYFKEYYPLEWRAAALSGVTRKDNKKQISTLMLAWSSVIKKPDINSSSLNYKIDGDCIVMPLTSIAQVGEKAIQSILKIRESGSFKDFQDFLSRITGARITKTVVMNLIFSGCFDPFKGDKESGNKWRKSLVEEFIKYRETHSKLTSVDKAQHTALRSEVALMDRSGILVKELQLLNLVSFDYETYYGNSASVLSKEYSGQTLTKMSELNQVRENGRVVILGGIKSVEFFFVKNEKSKIFGKEMAILTLRNVEQEIRVTVFPGTLSQDDERGGRFRKLTEFYPVMIVGKVSHYNSKTRGDDGELSMVMDGFFELVTPKEKES